MPGEAFAKLYRLTGGELRVLLVLARGVGAKEAADMLGISEATVRTHVQQMFAKTGTSRQADLLRLLQSSAPPTRQTSWPRQRLPPFAMSCRCLLVPGSGHELPVWTLRAHGKDPDVHLLVHRRSVSDVRDSHVPPASS